MGGDLKAPIQNNLHRTIIALLLITVANRAALLAFLLVHATERCPPFPHASQAASALAGLGRPQLSERGGEPPGPAPLGFVQGHGWGNPPGTLPREVSQKSGRNLDFDLQTR